MFWYELQDVLFFFKCLVSPSENFDITEYIDFSTSNTRLSTYNKLALKRSRTNTIRHFYFRRVAKLWNAMPPIELQQSFSTIKRQLYEHFWNTFLESFDPTIICTYHLACPCKQLVLSSFRYTLAGIFCQYVSPVFFNSVQVSIPFVQHAVKC